MAMTKGNVSAASQFAPQDASVTPQSSSSSSSSAAAASEDPQHGIHRESTDSSDLIRISSRLSGRVRSASLRLAQAPIPTGAWSGIGQSVGKAPSLADVRNGGVVSDEEVLIRVQRRSSELSQNQKWPRPLASAESTKTGLPLVTLPKQIESNYEDGRDCQKGEDGEGYAGVEVEKISSQANGLRNVDSKHQHESALETLPRAGKTQPIPNELGIYPNGYHFPPKKTWGQATVLGLRGLWHFTLTPIGFLIVLYCCNVVAWGGMLFLLLCNASPAMCRLGDGRVDCNDINSPRRIWIEYDSQVLTGLFCVTAFGLAPWRFRDLWCWAVWRVGRRHEGLRRLAGYKKSWFRLSGSDELPDNIGPETNDDEMEVVEQSTVPTPRRNVPNPPLTGARAPPTACWKLDFVVWCMVWNTFFQCVLCGFMWGMNRFDRPGWATGLFVAASCVVAGVGGIMEASEGKRVKAAEGVPLDTANAMADLEAGGPADGGGGEAKCGRVLS